MISNIENELYLGKAPAHIGNVDLFDYFLYVFEYTWGLFNEAKTYDNIKARLNTQFRKLSDDIDTEKKWWSLVLCFIKCIADNNGFNFLSETIKGFSNKIRCMDNIELAYYCSRLNLALRTEAQTSLIVRPLELLTLNASVTKGDSALQYFIENRERYIGVIKKSIDERSINSDYIFSLMSIRKEITYKFTDVWNLFYELFFTWYVSVISKIRAEHIKMNVDISEVSSEKIVLRLLGNAINDARTAEILSKRLNSEMKDGNFFITSSISE